jgi:hypothetical protein
MTVTLNLAALLIPLVALIVSIPLTLRQIRLGSGANHLPVILEAFRDVRDPAYAEAERYVLDDLTREHPAVCGWSGLPEPARTQTLRIGILFDDLGKLVAHGIVDEELVIGSFGMGIVRVWDVLAPYVYQERHAQANHFWIYFEDLACRTAARSNVEIYAALGLRARPPRPAPDTP